MARLEDLNLDAAINEYRRQAWLVRVNAADGRDVTIHRRKLELLAGRIHALGGTPPATK